MSDTFKLYIKKTPPTAEHLEGYLYLGKTNRVNDVKYTGSGKLWRKHLKKYNFTYKDIFTLVIYETDDKVLFLEKCNYYSNVYNIPNNKLFANLKKEQGDGGGDFTYEQRRKGGKTSGKLAKELGYGWFGINEKEKKELSSRGGKTSGKQNKELNRGWFGMTEIDKFNRNSAAGKKASNNPNHVNKKRLKCPHCELEGSYIAMKRWHFDNCKKNI